MRLLPWELFPELGYVTVRMLMWAQASQAKWLLGGPLGALVILILLQSAPKGPWSWGSQAEHIAGVFESVWLWSVAQVRFVFNENCPVGSERDAEGMDGFFESGPGVKEEPSWGASSSSMVHKTWWGSTRFCRLLETSFQRNSITEAYFFLDDWLGSYKVTLTWRKLKF